MKATIPIHIPPGMKVLRIERVISPGPTCSGCDKAFPDYYEQWDEQITRTHCCDAVIVPMHTNYWRIWIHTNDFIHGTSMRLYDDGTIERVTVRAGRADDDIQLVKPTDE
jgi:hypothetical protein